MSYSESGFRLAAPSECSMRSKARIDALFEDSRSISSSSFGGWYATSVSTPTSGNVEDNGSDEQRRVNNAVQARIEAMFASVEAENGAPGECAAAILSVKYLGAAPVGGRVACVQGLQEPLRQLVERISNAVPAELEVSRRGLTFRTSDTCEKNNPFRRMAVWSALRLQGKRTSSGDFHHAFVPLVNNDHRHSFGDKHADLYRTMRGLSMEVNDYPPLFAVVMRRPGAATVLECHAFACQSVEDAVAAAATLYRALLADLDGNRNRRPRHTNGVGCVSMGSVVSSVRDPSNLNDVRNSSAPVRPPRSKKNSLSCSSLTELDDRKSSSESNEKLPRRRKQVSEIKSEDVLEARSRRQSLAPIDSNKVERKNSRNKIYGTKQTLHDVDIYTGKKSNKSSRDQSKSSSKSSKSYEFDCCDEDYHYKDPHYMKSTFEHEPIITSEQKMYEKRRGSYEMGKSHGSYPLKENLPDNDQTYRTRENSIYEDHFRDADKIFSFEQENEIYADRKDLSKNGRDKTTAYKNAKNRMTTEKNSVSGESTNTSSKTRVSRVSTMDRRTKKPQQFENSGIPEKAVHNRRPRRRSRAGSEPPSCRTNEISRQLLQETNMKRSQSDVDLEKGDLMTRVELPRRGSFLNPASSSTRRTTNVPGGTPLGFTELFDEFRNQEGLTSVDDILTAIIDPEGMSFNDLKPLYKEFLLKLASTLTQDELYQRSASIMRRRRRPQRRLSMTRPCLLRRAIKRSVSRLKSGPTEFTSVIFPARRLNDSFGSSSSCDVKNNSHRSRVLGSRVGRRRSARGKPKAGMGQTTSEDSDTCRRISRTVMTANRSSSGYVSCSECSYDSESCTCISADKCYCSLSRKQSSKPKPEPTRVCICDTDSCSESNKCYCARKPVQPTILEQLRQRGIVPSESTLSRGGSPDRGKTARTSRSLASSKSLEFLKVRPSSTRGSSDNLALDYDLFSPGRQSQHSSNSEKVLVVSARDPQGRLVYVGGPEGDKKSLKHCRGRSGGHHEALSIKKSAEIAAVFGSGPRGSRRTSSASSLRSSVSLEAGLGYLP